MKIKMSSKYHYERRIDNPTVTIFVIHRFFEHPLTAATSAMLNISGNGSNNDEEPGTNGTAANVNIGALGTPHQVHQVHNPNGSTSFVYEYYKVPDKDGLQWR